MTIETAEQAAQAFVEGERKECRAWCYRVFTLESTSPHYVAQRTAAVALELVDKLIKHPRGSHKWNPREDFLLMMAGS